MILRHSSRAFEWPTLLLLAVTYALWAVGTTVVWSWSPVLAVILTALAVAQQSSLQHEALHGHPFGKRAPETMHWYLCLWG